MINTIPTSKGARQYPKPSSRRMATQAQNSRQRVGLLSLLFPLSCLLFLLSGCAVGPNYQRPKVNVPTEYRDAEKLAQQASIADLPWWEVFKDERLKNLVQTALANNYDLQIAVTRIEESRRGVLLSLVSDVAQAYFELLELDLQLQIARDTTDSFTQTLKLFTQRLEGGVASKLDTS